MKIRCEKKDLQLALNNVSRAAAVKSPTPAMEGILFEANNHLKLTAYDNRIGIYSILDVDIHEPGEAVIPARFLVDLFRRLPDGIVTVDVDESFTVTVRCGKSQTKIMGYDPQDFPELNVVNEYESISIPEGVLKSMISQTIFAVATNESRPIYTGVLFEISEKELTLVAVDGYRLAKRSEQLVSSDLKSTSFVIPGTSLSEVERICEANDGENVVIALGEKFVSFSIQNTVLITRRLEGEFMNYRKSIPSSFRYEVIAEREELMKTIERVALVIKDKQNAPIKMVVGEGILELFCTTGFGHAEDSCLCEGNGEELKVGFNDRYFTDVLKAADDDRLKISMNTPSAPIIIQAEEGNKYLYMVLPVRLRESE